MTEYNSLKPQRGEEVYAEWDEEFQVWGIFGLESGFCYAQPATREEADKEVYERNGRVVV